MKMIPAGRHHGPAAPWWEDVECPRRAKGGGRRGWLGQWHQAYQPMRICPGALVTQSPKFCLSLSSPKSGPKTFPPIQSIQKLFLFSLPNAPITQFLSTLEGRAWAPQQQEHHTHTCAQTHTHACTRTHTCMCTDAHTHAGPLSEQVATTYLSGGSTCPPFQSLPRETSY